MEDIQEYIPLYSVFILLLILSGGYVIQLVPCKLQKMLDTNIYIKHLFAFLTLIFLITLVDPNNRKIKLITIMQRSILLYLFFILIIKTNYKFYMAIMIILAIKYLLLLYKNQIQDEKENEKDNKKIMLMDNKINNIIFIQNILFGIIIFVLIIGFLVYYGEKKYEYKNKFNFITFIFGKPNCSYTESKISISDSLKYAL